MSLKLNIAYPRNNSQKTLEFTDEKKWAKLIDRRIGQEFDGEIIGSEFKGYVFKITGGSDRNGFCMKQGVATRGKVKLLLSPGTPGYRFGREGTRSRRTVRGCIIGNDQAAINVVILKKGDSEIAGLTDKTNPVRLGPKRANKIRKLFNLPKHSDNIGKKDAPKIDVDHLDVTRFVVKRITKEVGDKKYYKAPKIQRLVTSDRIRRKRIQRAHKFDQVKQNAKSLEDFKKKVAGKTADTKNAGKKEAPKAQTATKKDAPKTQTATKKDAPKKDAPKKDAPKAQTQAQAPVKKEAPKASTGGNKKTGKQ